MKKILLSTALALVLSAAQAETPLPKPAMVDGSIVNKAAKTREDIQAIEATVRIEAVDQEKRLLTVKNADGESTTLKVPEEIKRLAEVKVGDTINIAYYRSIAYELRAPTEEEKQNPGSLFGAAAKADADQTPGVGALGMAHAVTTIEKIDLENHLVTLKGPAGNQLQVEVKDAEVLKGLKPGDTVAVTVTESVAINLNPTP